MNICKAQIFFFFFFFLLQVTYIGTAQVASVLGEFAGITIMTNLHLAYLNSEALSQIPAEENSGKVTAFCGSNIWRNRCWAFVLSACSPSWIRNHKPRITLHWFRETELVFNFGSATCTLTCMFVGLNNETSGNEEFALCPSLIFEEEDLYLEGLGWCGKTGRKANHPDPGFCTTFLHWVNFCSEFNTIKITHRLKNGR